MDKRRECRLRFDPVQLATGLLLLGIGTFALPAYAGDNAGTNAPARAAAAAAAQATAKSASHKKLVHGASPAAQNAALRKLFHSDPHFGKTDGLAVDTDDYRKPDPLPPGTVSRMEGAKFLGLGTQEPQKLARAAKPAQPH